MRKRVDEAGGQCSASLGRTGRLGCAIAMRFVALRRAHYSGSIWNCWGLGPSRSERPRGSGPSELRSRRRNHALRGQTDMLLCIATPQTESQGRLREFLRMAER